MFRSPSTMLRTGVDPDDGLNQYTNVGGATLTHDAKGNLTSDGTSAFAYSSENLLTSGPGGTSLGYDPLLRLHQVASATTTRFGYDGLRMIGEYGGSGALQRRYVFGPGLDEPIVQYEGSGTSDRRFLSSDERGSIIARTSSAGALLGINSYDEYGIPGAANVGRFGYTGQAFLPELGLSYYKARMYHPVLGRFLQTDPIGYADSLNLYAYVANDPVNFVDPLGLQVCSDENVDTSYDGSGGNAGCDLSPVLTPDIVVTGNRCSLPEVVCAGERDFSSSLTGGVGTTAGGSSDPGGGWTGPFGPGFDGGQANPDDDDETPEERRKRLIEEERLRVLRNAFCANLRVQAALAALGFGAGGSFVANLIDNKWSFRQAATATLSRGSIIVVSGLVIYAGATATQGYPQCK